MREFARSVRWSGSHAAGARRHPPVPGGEFSGMVRSQMPESRGDSLQRLRAEAIISPALVRAGGAWVSGAARMWFRLVQGVLEESLSGVLGTPCVLGASGEAARGESECVFGIELVCGDRHVWISLDLKASRAVADTLTSGLGGLRGSGPLTDGEVGVLEFVVLDAVDRLCRRLSMAPGSVEVKSLGTGAVSSSVEGEAVLHLAVGAKKGRVRVRIEGPAGIEVPTIVPDRTHVTRPGSVVARILAGELGLSATEQDHVEPGDTVLLDASDEGALLRSPRLVTSTGWCLGECGVGARSSTLWTVELRSFDPSPMSPGASGEAGPVFLMFGEAVLSVGDIERLGAGARIELSVSPSSPAVLVRDHRVIGAGELLRCGEQLALRVLSWDRSGEHGRTAPER